MVPSAGSEAERAGLTCKTARSRSHSAALASASACSTAGGDRGQPLPQGYYLLRPGTSTDLRGRSPAGCTPSPVWRTCICFRAAWYLAMRVRAVSRWERTSLRADRCTLSANA